MVNPKAEPGTAPMRFTFDQVYDMDTRQIDLYDITARSIVDSVLDVSACRSPFAPRRFSPLFRSPDIIPWLLPRRATTGPSSRTARRAAARHSRCRGRRTARSSGASSRDASGEEGAHTLRSRTGTNGCSASAGCMRTVSPPCQLRRHIFSAISNNSVRQYVVRASFLEIYNGGWRQARLLAVPCAHAGLQCCWMQALSPRRRGDPRPAEP